MAIYRSDLDLEFLQACDNDDLDVLVTYLIGKDGDLRCAEELTAKAVYKEHRPNHQRYWQDIAAELQTFAGNTFANIARGDRGVLYREVLCDVCRKMKVNFNAESRIELIEMNLLMKVLTDSIDKMTPEQLKELVDTTGLKTTNLTPQAVTAALQIAARMSGFAVYRIALIVANAVARAVIGRGLSLAANAALARTIAIFAGPIGWIITGVWTVVDLAGPAYRVTIPSVIQVAYMRAKAAAAVTVT